jgi:ATP-dependent exoDNAse (exonuclease V) beta subunit
MISKSENETLYFEKEEDEIDKEFETKKHYVYLFRCWKNILLMAQRKEKVWIYNYEKQMDFIQKLHAKLQVHALDEEELNAFEDDLPKFLLKLNAEELEEMREKIEANRTDKESATCHMYTIHSYKGLESDVVRVYHDVDIEEKNLFYVALTRGRKEIYLNKKDVHVEQMKPKIDQRVVLMPKSKAKKEHCIHVESMNERVNPFQKYELLFEKGKENPITDSKEKMGTMDTMYNETYTTLCGHHVSIKTVFKRKDTDERQIQIIIRGEKVHHGIKYMYTSSYENALRMVRAFLHQE